MNYRRLFIANSLVFITIVTSKRRNILIDNIDLLKNSLKITNEKLPFRIIAIVVMPNHIHMIIKPKDIKTYPNIIKLIKSKFSQYIDCSKIHDYKVSNSKLKKDEKDIWQRRYWEHTIKDEEDLNKHIDYIHYNPVKHKLVKSVKDWEYSSFKKFVHNKFYEMDWCNFNDKNKINQMNLD